MPRTYIRKKPELAPVTEQLIAKAKELIRKGKSKRSAATAIGISESCLRKRLRLGVAATSMGRFKPTFNDEQEDEFVVHCKKMDERYFGLTINDLRRLAYEYASANKISNRFDQSSKMAGRDWVECFLKRHPTLVIRQSSATSLARAIGFNKSQVDRFYKNLKELYEKYKFQPSRIYKNIVKQRLFCDHLCILLRNAFTYPICVYLPLRGAHGYPNHGSSIRIPKFGL